MLVTVLGGATTSVPDGTSLNFAVTKHTMVEGLTLVLVMVKLHMTTHLVT